MTFQRKVEIELSRLGVDPENAALSDVASSILDICGVTPDAHFVAQDTSVEKFRRYSRIADSFEDAKVTVKGSYIVISGCGLELCLNINAWGAIDGFLDDTSGG